MCVTNAKYYLIFSISLPRHWGLINFAELASLTVYANITIIVISLNERVYINFMS